MAVNHNYVNSNTISTIGYDREGQKLHVAFHSGGRYTYHDVPPEVHQELMDAESKGKYLHSNIKGKHRHSK